MEALVFTLLTVLTPIAHTRLELLLIGLALILKATGIKAQLPRPAQDKGPRRMGAIAQCSRAQ